MTIRDDIVQGDDTTCINILLYINEHARELLVKANVIQFIYCLSRSSLACIAWQPYLKDLFKNKNENVIKIIYIK